MIVLSIGTSHPWNVAGIGRDLVIGTRLGARVFTAIAAVSAQDAQRAIALDPVSERLLGAQLETLPWEAAGAVRVGALGSAANVRIVATTLRAHPNLRAVVDPVFAASNGGALADPDAILAMRDDLARLPNVVLTPNIGEAEALLGASVDATSIQAAALELRARGAAAVLLKGGHLHGDPVDLLADADGVERFTQVRIAANMRGTGCTLAMALACAIAGGAPLRDAVRSARALVREELAAR